MVWSVEWSRPPESCFWALVCVLSLSLSLSVWVCVCVCVCVWYMTLAIWRRCLALPLQAAWKGAEKPDELKPLFNKTSESFSNTRLRCPSNWLLDFRIYMNPPKAAYLCSDAPWVCIHSLLMWISINSCNLFLFYFSLINAKLATVDNLRDLLKCLNLFILNKKSCQINLNPSTFGTVVLI